MAAGLEREKKAKGESKANEKTRLSLSPPSLSLPSYRARVLIYSLGVCVLVRKVLRRFEGLLLAFLDLCDMALPQEVIHEAGDLPPELTFSPVPLVGLFGLSASQDQLHASIWNSFTVNRQFDRVPLYFKLFGEAQAFPVVKPKVSSSSPKALIC